MSNLDMMSETAIMGGMLLTVFVTTLILVAKALETDRINRRIKTAFKASKKSSVVKEVCLRRNKQ